MEIGSFIHGTNPCDRTLWSMGGESEVSDEVLWKLVVNGDGDAFGELFDRHRDRVLRHALRVARSPHTAEDVTAIVFYEAWRRRAYVRIAMNRSWLGCWSPRTTRSETMPASSADTDVSSTSYQHRPSRPTSLTKSRMLTNTT